MRTACRTLDRHRVPSQGSLHRVPLTRVHSVPLTGFHSRGSANAGSQGSLTGFPARGFTRFHSQGSTDTGPSRGSETSVGEPCGTQWRELRERNPVKGTPWTRVPSTGFHSRGSADAGSQGSIHMVPSRGSAHASSQFGGGQASERKCPIAETGVANSRNHREEPCEGNSV